jgi:hypothetical protein
MASPWLAGARVVDDLRRIAFEVVMRACGFALLAIFCIMVGMSFEPRMAFRTGGYLTLLMVAVLALKAWEARTKPYRRTEMWLYLSKEQRPHPGTAQQLMSNIMRETYLTFALWTSYIAIALIIVAIGLWVAGL